MSRYRSLHCLIWNDDKFPFVSDDGQLVFFHTFTNPLTNQIGLYKASVAGLAADKRWSEERYRKGIEECIENQFIEVDERFQVVWFPNFFRWNQPHNPNILKSWLAAFDEVPNCPLKMRAFESLEEYASHWGDGHLEVLQGYRSRHPKMFGEPLGERYPKRSPERSPEPMPKQEQEQEQETTTTPSEPPTEEEPDPTPPPPPPPRSCSTSPSEKSEESEQRAELPRLSENPAERQAPPDSHLAEGTLARDELIFPAKLNPAEVVRAWQLVCLFTLLDAQTLLDELAWRLDPRHNLVHTPLAFLRTLCECHKAGTFQPTGALQVREAREAVRRQAAREAAARKKPLPRGGGGDPPRKVPTAEIANLRGILRPHRAENTP